MNLLRSLLFLFWAGWTVSLPAAEPVIPWMNGEQLTYEVRWGLFVAAEGTFLARSEGDLWKISLDLKSRGLVDATVPIQSRFESDMVAASWRMTRFYADRHEGSHTKKYLVQMQPGQKEGTYEDFLKENYRPKKFEAPEGDWDDILSFLYNLRRHDWPVLKEKKWVVSDRWKVKYAKAVFQGLETIQDSGGVKRECQYLFVEELDEKGVPKNNGWMRIWITNDEKRIPLKARVKMSFGTFSVVIKP